MSPRARIAAGFGVALLLLLGSGFISYRSARTLAETARRVARAHQALAASYDLRAQLSGAESARRGYVLTGGERFAEVFGRAAAAARRRQQELMAARVGTEAERQELDRALRDRMAMLEQSIALRRRDPGALAVQMERTEAGRRLTDSIFGLLDAVESEQLARVEAGEEEARRSTRTTLRVVLGGSAVAVLLIAATTLLLLREAERRRSAQEALRRNEALHRRVLSHFPNGAVLLYDHDLRYQLVEGVELAEVGLSKERMEGRTIWEVLPPETCAAVEPGYRAALEGRATVLEVPFADRVYCVRLQPIRDESGAVTHGLVVTQNVTAEKQAEEVIVRLNRDLERGMTELTAANQELEAFTYSVSHDLRAPLRHVHGFVDLLRRSSRDRLDETGQRQLDTIARAARNMGQLIDDLLAFSRVSRTRPRREPVDLAFLVREVVQPIRVETAESGVEWTIGELPQVMADPALLRIVLTNLLGNAVKYSRQSARPRIEIGSQPGADGLAVVYVRDNGVGFDMEYAGKLFGVFQRLHRAEEFEGTGIGLATVRRIVTRHGGQTWAEGRPGEGATFYFSLPRAEAAPPGDEGAGEERSA